MDTVLEESSTNAKTRLGIVDCDVHPHLRDGLNDLMPYLSAASQRRIGVGHAASWASQVYASQFSLPKNVMYVNTAGVMRRDSLPEDGSIPASDPAFVAEQHLDTYGIDRAVLIGGNVLGLGALPDADIASAVASAYNDWLTARWLEADDRYRGALVVAPQDPRAAAEEIRRVGSRPGMVQVLLPLTNILMGDRHYFPIYEAAHELGLPICVHPNSVDGVFAKGPPLAGGVFSYYIEWHTALTQVFHSSVISLVCQGVFDRFPGMKVVIAEGGFVWLVDLMWRLDKNWQALRDEVPWLTRPPSEYIVEHIRFTTQPFAEPSPEHLRCVAEIIHADRTLVFSSDYPHWDADNPKRALAGLPKETQQRILAESAIELYGDRL